MTDTATIDQSSTNPAVLTDDSTDSELESSATTSDASAATTATATATAAEAASESSAETAAEPELPTPKLRTISNYDPQVDLADLYANSFVPVVEGQMVQGKVVQVDADEVLLDIGYKSEGVIPFRELTLRNDVSTFDLVNVGDELEAIVITREDRAGRLLLSKKRAQFERAWDNITKVKEDGTTIKGVVIEAVKGGLILDIGLRGFLPASLVDLRRVKDLEPYIGQTLETKILEIDRSRNNVILSRRDWLQEDQRERRETLLEKMKPGEKHKGTVASIASFGAFVDLGGMDGLVHVSELSWKHITHPTDVVAVGDEVEVMVLEVDFERERVSLSLRATQQDPWEEFVETHQVGELVYSRVSKLVPFGAFVQVGEAVEGLVHISELSNTHVESAAQVVTAGEELWVKIIDIDAERRRISLSIKQAAEGGAVAAEYQEHFGEEAFDEQGNYVGGEGSQPAEADAVWAEYYSAQQNAGAGENEDFTEGISYEVRDVSEAPAAAAESVEAAAVETETEAGGAVETAESEAVAETEAAEGETVETDAEVSEEEQAAS